MKREFFDVTFSSNQFLVEASSYPLRLNQNIHGGDIMLFVREDIFFVEVKRILKTSCGKFLFRHTFKQTKMVTEAPKLYQ